jgi:hypothetical protein
MQSFKNAVFSAPSNFLYLVSLRQAVRLACFAAASPAAAVEAGTGAETGAGVEAGAAVEGAGAWDAAGRAANTKMLRHRALAVNARRMFLKPRT